MQGGSKNIEDKVAGLNPWKRKSRWAPDDYDYGPSGYLIEENSFDNPFEVYEGTNRYLDITTMRATLKISASVVSIKTFIGEKELFWGSGTVIECKDVDGTFFGTILTSSSVIRDPNDPTCDVQVEKIEIDVYLSGGNICKGEFLAFDFHYNIATIRIKLDAAVPVATLRNLDDSVSITANPVEHQRFQRRRHSSLFKISPGDTVIAIGRHFTEPYDIMAAPGKYSIDRCKFDCKELFRANLKITLCGIGGPVINCYGEVIGVAFYDKLCTPFLPVNIVSEWWEHFKTNGEYRRPWLGMEVTNLFAADLYAAEKFIQKFPNFVEGITIEKVTPGSPAHVADIHAKDIIVECCGNAVQSFLQFYEMIWNKAKEPVELVVLRASDKDPLNVTMVMDETRPDNFNSWPIPPSGWVRRKRILG